MTPTSQPTWSHSLQATARLALTRLDLTCLNDADSEADIARLYQRANNALGPVAAVCVWARLAAFVRAQLPAHIGVAAVANFPQGGTDIAAAVRDTAQIVLASAQEVHVVLPHKASGSIRRVADAAFYLALTRQFLGDEALNPKRSRRGASSILNDIEVALGSSSTPGAAPSGNY